ncbi:biotin transporter BioY [Salarchaeum sp. JOR-1]|uniref:biotin transporter BioY n=1 Tax=Salarchaeum sp. JOR-1 TaxID=2599399 RepID=UPI0011987D8C|nr:biotin transporter BioY [Salarchaeum sp. JOR-1]QDX40297.1 biotin transporter BioY [Salarchaeum sp. JOR-1]
MSTNHESVDLVGDQIVGNLARAALFAALTGVFAYVSFQLPVSSVPFTLQVLGVFLAGAFLGPVWGFAAMALYVVAGAVGVPVYAYGASGLGTLFGQWGGYLWSYPLAAAIVGYAAHGADGLRDLDAISLPRLVAGMAVATALIYAFGTVFFAYVGNVGLVEAALTAAVPFVPAELLKMGATVAAVRADGVTAA